MRQHKGAICSKIDYSANHKNNWEMPLSFETDITAALHGEAAKTPAIPAMLYDPKLPILGIPNASEGTDKPLLRQGQKWRRAEIMATIRKLLIEHGYQGVTIRRIAEMSGRAVQTIYNLLGPREDAIIQAISEYTTSVAQSFNPDPSDPEAIRKMVETQIRSVEEAPAFCQQVCRIYFTNDRQIYYKFRDLQARGLYAMLIKQKRNRIIRPEVNCLDLATNFMACIGSHYIEWSDGNMDFETLRKNVNSSCYYMFSGALMPTAAH